MTGNAFDEATVRGLIDDALADFAFYPENIPADQDMYFNEQQIIDLSNVMLNETGSEITYEVFANSDTEAVTASIDGSDLILDSHEKMTTTKITIRTTVPDQENRFEFYIETHDPILFENLNESFEGGFEPDGWALKTTGAGWIQISDAHSGSFSAAHYWDTGAQNDWLFTPKMAITGNAILTFWEKTRYSSDGIHSIGISKDLNRTTMVEYNIPQTDNWQQSYIDLSAYDGQEIYIGFNYQGDYSDMWVVDDVRLWTTTGICDRPATINGNTLYQNYPNPFNPTTEIKFSLENNSNVKLDVYNSNGEIVSSLVNNLMEKGSHSVNFNASELTGGIYFYKLNVDGRSMTKKMLLLK